MNNSGLKPVGRHILVKPDEIEEVTEGGILLPEETRTRYGQAVSTGVVVDIGPDAFTHGTTEVYRLVDGQMRLVERRTDGYQHPFCKVGDRICFAKFAGKGIPGKDGDQYRIMNDEDVTGLADVEVNFAKLTPREQKLGRRHYE
jgi:chaperonin GroES